MSLTEKQLAFAQAKAAGATHKDAATQAGYASASAAVTATKLMAREDVRAEIDRLRNGAGEVPLEDAVDSWQMKDSYDSPLALLEDLYNNPKAPKSLRYQAAKDALPYCHARKEGGKKEEAAKESKKAAAGKFGSTPAPSHLRRVA